VFTAAGTIYETSETITDHNFVLTIDTSNVMTSRDLEAIKRTSIKFIQGLPQGIKVGLVSFSDKAIIENELTSNKNNIINAIQTLKLTNNEERNIRGSIVESVTLLRSEQEDIARVRSGTPLETAPEDIVLAAKPRTIILTTSLKNTETSLERATTLANIHRATIHTIGIDLEQEIDRKDSIAETLELLSRSTQAEYFTPENEISIQQAYNRVAATLKGTRSTSLANPLLTAVFIFLLLGWLLEYVRYGTIP